MSLQDELRQRTLVAHGGNEADELEHHWNLSGRDSTLHKQAADALDRLTAERDAATQIIAGFKSEWSDRELTAPFRDEIEAAHPMRTEDYGTYDEALKLVNDRRSKYSLVDCMNWLLSRAKRAEAENAALRRDAEWQPIETAPKHGGVILTYDTNTKEMETARWIPGYEYWKTTAKSQKA